MKSKNWHFLFFTECCSDCAIKNHWILASTNALFMLSWQRVGLKYPPQLTAKPV